MVNEIQLNIKNVKEAESLYFYVHIKVHCFILKCNWKQVTSCFFLFKLGIEVLILYRAQTFVVSVTIMAHNGLWRASRHTTVKWKKYSLGGGRDTQLVTQTVLCRIPQPNPTERPHARILYLYLAGRNGHEWTSYPAQEVVMREHESKQEIVFVMATYADFFCSVLSSFIHSASTIHR